MLALLIDDADQMIAQRAAATLLSQPLEGFLAALARPDAPPQLFRYCAKHLADKAGVADALAQNRNCRLELLVPAAKHFSTAAVQALLDDLDRLSSSPALAAVLATSSSLTAEQRHALQELQQDHSDPSAFEDALAELELDEAKRQTLLQRLTRMRVMERVQMALKGTGEERLALIRDPCRIVQRAVLQSPKIGEREIEAYSAMANLSEEVLRLIGVNRNWLKNYTVVRNLINNPKTPLEISLHLLPNITAQDLKFLTMNKNIPETLRTMAVRLHRQRTLARQQR